MNKFLLAALVACLSWPALAQQFDSGWRIVAANDLSDLELSGAGVRINNMVITQVDPPRNNATLATYTFSATALKRTAGRRNIRIELIGIKADNKPSVTSVVVMNINDEQPNKMSVDQHRFVAYPAELSDTMTYFIRVLIP